MDRIRLNSWNVDVRKLIANCQRLRPKCKKPLYTTEAPPLREPAEIIQEIQDLDHESAEILNSISNLI